MSYLFTIFAQNLPLDQWFLIDASKKIGLIPSLIVICYWEVQIFTLLHRVVAKIVEMSYFNFNFFFAHNSCKIYIGIWNSEAFSIKRLNEFYTIFDLGIVCLCSIIKYFCKNRFQSRKNTIFLKNVKWKMVPRIHHIKEKLHKTPKFQSQPVFFFFN